MRTILLFFSVVFCFSLSQAQEKTQTTKAAPKEGWTKKGDFSILFNQSAFSNWVAGGENTIAGNVGVNYQFNYLKGNLTWHNRVSASYGLTKSKNIDFEKKTDDRLEFNSVMGLKAKNYWYYSLLFDFKTQFTKGFKYEKDTNGKEIRTEFTNFMSPATLFIGPGMLWEKNNKFKLNIAPATTKFVLVDAIYTLPNKAYYGVEEGERLRVELGFNASTYAKFNLFENISMENTLSLYSNYLEEMKNIDIDYTMLILMHINKHMSTNIVFQTIYDDNAYEGFQIREVIGFGLKFAF